MVMNAASPSEVVSGCASVRPSSCFSADHTGLIDMKFDFGVFYENLSTKNKWLKST